MYDIPNFNEAMEKVKFFNDYQHCRYLLKFGLYDVAGIRFAADYKYLRSILKHYNVIFEGDEEK